MAKVQLTEEKLNAIISECIIEVLNENSENELLNGLLGAKGADGKRQGGAFPYIGNKIKNKVSNAWNNVKQQYNAGEHAGYVNDANAAAAKAGGRFVPNEEPQPQPQSQQAASAVAPAAQPQQTASTAAPAQQQRNGRYAQKEANKISAMIDYYTVGNGKKVFRAADRDIIIAALKEYGQQHPELMESKDLDAIISESVEKALKNLK